MIKWIIAILAGILVMPAAHAEDLSKALSATVGNFEGNPDLAIAGSLALAAQWQDAAQMVHPLEARPLVPVDLDGLLKSDSVKIVTIERLESIQLKELVATPQFEQEFESVYEKLRTDGSTLGKTPRDVLLQGLAVAESVSNQMESEFCLYPFCRHNPPPGPPTE